MSEDVDPEVTLRTLHQDLGEVKALVTAGLRAFPPDWPGEMLRPLRENTQRLLSADMRALIGRPGRHRSGAHPASVNGTFT